MMGLRDFLTEPIQPCKKQTVSTMNKENIDMLGKIFEMQTELNDYVFKKNNLRDDSGNALAMDTIFNSVSND